MKQRTSLNARIPSYGGGFDRTLRNVDHKAFLTWYDRRSLVTSIGNAG